MQGLRFESQTPQKKSLSCILPYILSTVLLLTCTHVDIHLQLPRFELRWINLKICCPVKITQLVGYIMHYYMQGPGFEPRTPYLFTL